MQLKPECHRDEEASLGAEARQERRGCLGAQAGVVEVEMPVEYVLRNKCDDGPPARQTVAHCQIDRAELRRVVGLAVLGGETYVLRYQGVRGLTEESARLMIVEAERQILRSDFHRIGGIGLACDEIAGVAAKEIFGRRVPTRR